MDREGHDKRHPILVAVSLQNMKRRALIRRENVLGWGSISSYSPRPCYSGIEEFSVYVERISRRNGVGRALTKALVHEAKRLGYWKIIGRIFAFNVASRNLCRSCGFREVGVHRKHGKLGERWFDVVVVEKLIHENLT